MIVNFSRKSKFGSLLVATLLCSAIGFTPIQAQDESFLVDQNYSTSSRIISPSWYQSGPKYWDELRIDEIKWNDCVHKQGRYAIRYSKPNIEKTKSLYPDLKDITVNLENDQLITDAVIQNILSLAPQTLTIVRGTVDELIKDDSILNNENLEKIKFLNFVNVSNFTSLLKHKPIVDKIQSLQIAASTLPSELSQNTILNDITVNPTFGGFTLKEEDLKGKTIEHFSIQNPNGELSFAKILPLSKQADSLKTLKICVGKIEEDDNSIKEFFDNLKNTKKLEVLEVSADKITSKVLTSALTNLIAQNPDLRSISLRTGCDEGGWKELSKSLGQLKKIEEIIFNQAQITNTTIYALDSFFKNNDGLRVISLEGNPLDGKGVKSLFSSLTSKNLEQLSLTDIAIGGYAADLAKGIESQDNLTLLNLRGCGVDDAGLLSIASALHDKPEYPQVFMSEEKLTKNGFATFIDKIKTQSKEAYHQWRMDFGNSSLDQQNIRISSSWKNPFIQISIILGKEQDKSVEAVLTDNTPSFLSKWTYGIL